MGEDDGLIMVETLDELVSNVSPGVRVAMALLGRDAVMSEVIKVEDQLVYMQFVMSIPSPGQNFETSVYMNIKPNIRLEVLYGIPVAPTALTQGLSLLALLNVEVETFVFQEHLKPKGYFWAKVSEESH